MTACSSLGDTLEYLVVNPHVRLGLARGGSGLGSIHVEAPVRHEGLRATLVAEGDPLWPFLMKALAGGRVAWQGLASNERDRLRAMGYLVPRDRVPARVRFRSLLADVVPVAAAERGDWYVNATMVVTRHETTPPASLLPLAPIWDREWVGDHYVAWLRDPRTGLVHWYELDASVADTLEALRSGTRRWVDLDDATLRLLTAAGLLVRATPPVAPWDRHRAEFARDGYTAIESLLPPGLVVALRRYYRDLVVEGAMTFAAEKGRFVYDEDPVSGFFHEQLTPLIAAITGRELKPSCVLVAAYEGGGVLSPHRDVLPFEWTISTQIDCDPPASQVWPWPLEMDTKVDGGRRMVPIRLAPGDGLLYSGLDLVHARARLPEGHRSTSLLMHYVRQDYSGGRRPPRGSRAQ